jgi:hypothetical protein
MTPTPKRLRSENRPIAPSNPEDMTSWTRTALNKPTSTDTVPVLLEYFGKGLVVVPWAIVQLSRWRQRQAFYLTRFFVFLFAFSSQYLFLLCCISVDQLSAMQWPKSLDGKLDGRLEVVLVQDELLVSSPACFSFAYTMLGPRMIHLRLLVNTVP